MDKPKRGHRRRFYSQNVMFLAVCCALLLMLFFRADDWLGAIGLRQYYREQTLIAGYMLLLTILVFAILWRGDRGIALLSAVISAIGIAAVWTAFQAVVGLFLADDLVSLVSSQTLLISLGIAGIFWILGFRQSYSPAAVNSLVMGVLIFAATYILSIPNGSIHYRFLAERQTEEHHYMFIVQTDDKGYDVSYLLYECNQHRLFCAEVYMTTSIPAIYFFRADVFLVPAESGVSIEVDGEIIHTHHPE